MATEVTRRLGVEGPRRYYEYFMHMKGSPEMAASPELAEALGEGLGRYAEAAKVMKIACELRPEQHYCGYHAYTLLKAGRAEEAAAVAEMSAGLTETEWGAQQLASYHALAGQWEQALDYIGRARQLAQSIDNLRSYVEKAEAFDPIRDDPALAALLK